MRAGASGGRSRRAVVDGRPGALAGPRAARPVRLGAPFGGRGRPVAGHGQRTAAATITTTSSTANRPDMIRLRVLGSTL